MDHLMIARRMNFHGWSEPVADLLVMSEEWQQIFHRSITECFAVPSRSHRAKTSNTRLSMGSTGPSLLFNPHE
ncbi:hypothetical protein A6X21_07315 [Planctopirus hydrillae]|uniref:Uncharacterized protein n=1 Tax=Planctopirus hydrillae TaxID=1841610 RepID=A0A1C3E964_9PLAN|nr:hypothetical protein A6X21_07315 [Planctopirus hydrillae]